MQEYESKIHVDSNATCSLTSTAQMPFTDVVHAILVYCDGAHNCRSHRGSASWCFQKEKEITQK